MTMIEAETRAAASGVNVSGPVLEVENLGVTLVNGKRRLPIVTGISFKVAPGEALALVGESGCGKSMTASAIIGLPPDNAEVTGSIRLKGSEINGLSRNERRRLCGRHIGFIFQEPMTALHPTLTIGRQMTDSLRHNLGLPKAAAHDRAAELLDRVGIPRSKEILSDYVHQLSGGMRQRVMIALAISCGPSLVIADEPTTALDVTIQAQVLDLMEEMRREMDLAMVFITHDLEVVADFCDRAVVMYAGDVVERASSAELVAAPRHPYSRGLIDAIPARQADMARLKPIPGTVPQVGEWPAGCRFQTRCAFAQSWCAEHPPLEGGMVSAVRCWFPLEGRAA
jgi:oligopeptide/dipeptide ABC transporter ATP-binding protein